MLMRAVYNYQGVDQESKDAEIRAVFTRYNGKSIGSGAMLADPFERDIEYDIADLFARNCADALLKIKGVKVICP